MASYNNVKRGALSAQSPTAKKIIVSNKLANEDKQRLRELSKIKAEKKIINITEADRLAYQRRKNEMYKLGGMGMKNTEWLKEQVNDYLDIEGVEDARMALKAVLGYIDQLEEAEVLSDKWISEKSIDTHIDTLNGEIQVTFILDDLQNLLVPKQKEVKRVQIPEWIIEWYQGANNEFSTLEDVFSNLSHDTGYSIMDSEKFRSRIMEYGGYSRMYEALSHIYFGVYEIEEEEQKYYVMNNDNRMMLVRMMDGKTITEADPFKLEDMFEVEKKSHRLTEQEIKDYDPRYMTFAKQVEELEE